MFKTSIDHIVQRFLGNKLFSSSKVAGALAFCRNAMPAELDNFIDQLNTGENIKRGDPAYALRNTLINNSHGSGSFHEGVYWAGTAAYYYMKGEPLKQMKTSTVGIDFFSDKQPRLVNKVREIYGIKK